MKKLLVCSLYILAVGCTYDCKKSDGFHINFIGFTEAEIKTYTVKKYDKGASFTSFVDSLVYDSTKIGYAPSNDTLRVTSALGGTRLTSDFDYIIFIPSTNKTYQIIELFEPQQKGKRTFGGNKKLCGNQILSAKVNNVGVLLQSDNLFLKK